MEELQVAVASALDVVNMDTVAADERIAKYNALIAKATNPDVIASLTETRDRIQNQGDKIISQCDSIVLEADIDIEIIELVFNLAKKYHKNVYPIVSNMSLVLERKQYIPQFACFICNQQEAGMLFNEDYDEKSPEQLCEIIKDKTSSPLVVTMDAQGAVYVDQNKESGIYPAHKVQVLDTTGAGDAFCAGVVSGLTYGKPISEAVKIGTRLAASVIVSSENVCPRFSHEEFGIDL
jgi:pseudouridine kinase